jgi:hypothetical protein
MAATDLVIFNRDAANRTKTCVEAFERNGGRPHNNGRPSRQGLRPPIRGILLEDLETDGVADCAVTIKVSSPVMQKLTLLGDASGGTFKLGFKGKTTDSIKYNATAAELQTALEKLETIGTKNVRVSLGLIPKSAARDTEFPGVWIIEFIGTFLSRDPSTIPLMTIPETAISTSTQTIVITEVSEWMDSGVVEQVNGTIPVGTPTPMHAGAVVACIWFPGIGYGFPGVEPRQFSSPY